MQNRLLHCSLLLTLALSRTALAGDNNTQCQEQIPKWVPTEYFGPGIIVRYEGHWYQSQLLQSGNEPGGTNMFAWKAIQPPPHCASGNSEETTSTTAQSAGKTPPTTPHHAASTTPPTTRSEQASTPTPSAAKPLPASTDEARREQEQRLDAQSAHKKKSVNAFAKVLGLDKQDKPLTKKVCGQVTSWSFTDSYIVGSLVSFQGQFYRAIRPTNGDMPGKSIPPRWEPVKLP